MKYRHCKECGKGTNQEKVTLDPGGKIQSNFDTTFMSICTLGMSRLIMDTKAWRCCECGSIEEA